jgi:hypothetical protein
MSYQGQMDSQSINLILILQKAAIMKSVLLKSIVLAMLLLPVLGQAQTWLESDNTFSFNGMRFNLLK